MTTSPKGIALIKRFEGLRLKAYLDPVGVATIGYGHTYLVNLNDPEITEAEADRLLAEDLKLYEKPVSEMVKVPINQNQFDALIILSYNIGTGALRGSTLMKKLNAGQPCSAEFDRWIFGGQKALPGLVRRRAAERRLFESL
jgi:lysozyme